MILSLAQRTALRFGAIMCLIAVPVLGIVAVSIVVSSSGDEQLSVVAGSTVTLPDPGLFGRSSVVYGPTSERPSPSDLGCRLLSDSGEPRSTAKLSHLSVVSKPKMVVDGAEMSPLFSVSHAKGDRVECTDLGSVTPLALSTPSTFGTSAGPVLALAASGALICLVLGVGGLVIVRPAK